MKEELKLITMTITTFGGIFGLHYLYIWLNNGFPIELIFLLRYMSMSTLFILSSAVATAVIMYLSRNRWTKIKRQTCS